MHTAALKMSEYSSQEARRSGVAASYSPHRLFIRTSSQADLDPEFGDPFVDAVATHAHEYVHYLHNVSTPAGLHLFVANLWLARSLKHGTDDKGQYRDGFELGDQEAKYLRLAKNWTCAIWGGIEVSPPSGRASSENWNFGRLTRATVSLPITTPAYNVEVAEIEVIISTNLENARTGKIRIGYDLISEGVAYEVERGIRKNAGQPVETLDDGVPFYPYLVFGYLVDHFAGRKTGAEERIMAGVSALLSTSPGDSLIDACKVLSGYLSEVSANELRVAFSPATLNFQKSWRKILDKTIRPELFAISPGGTLQSASRDVLKLIEAALQARAVDGYLELRLYSEALDKKSYRQLVAELVDCCVIQDLPGEVSKFEWVGGGIVGVDHLQVENLAILQSVLEFASWHYSPSADFRPTSSLKMSCPFYRACPMREDICRENPWKRFPDARLAEQRCWFSSGVVALSNF